MWGKETIINLYGCRVITEPLLRAYAKGLCTLIDVKPYGETLTPYFGNEFARGYTLVQLIETSSITGHFAEESNAAYINVFSCKDYDEKIVAKATKEHFGAERIEVTVLKRK